MPPADVLQQLRIDRQAGQPAGAQLGAQFRKLIREGYLLPGDPLPGITEISRTLDVGRTTVVRCMQDLAHEGLVVSRWGAGNYVAETPAPMTTQVMFNRTMPRGPTLRAYYDQVHDALRQTLEEQRRISLSFLDGHVPTARELLHLLRALRADSLLSFRPMGAMIDSLRSVADHCPVASAFFAVPDSQVDTVASQPGPPLRRLLERRVRGGRKVIGFVGQERLLLQGGPDSPYLAMQHAYLEFMREAGLEPRLQLVREDEEAPAFRDVLRRTYGGFPAEATVVTCLYPPIPLPSLDLIGYTEFDRSVEERLPHATLLYLDVRLVIKETARLMMERVSGRAAGAGRRIALEPVVLECAADAGRQTSTAQ